MSVNEFAVEVGVAATEIYRAISNGRLTSKSCTRVGRGWDINVHLAKQEWTDNADRATALERKTAAITGRFDDIAGPLPVTMSSTLQGDAVVPAFADSRARKTAWEAAQLELDYRREAGELMPVALLEKQGFALGRLLRDSLTHLADSLSPRVAAVSDEFECHRIISASVFNVATKIYAGVQKIVQQDGVSESVPEGVGAAAAADSQPVG